MEFINLMIKENIQVGGIRGNSTE